MCLAVAVLVSGGAVGAMGLGQEKLSKNGNSKFLESRIIYRKPFQRQLSRYQRCGLVKKTLVLALLLAFLLFFIAITPRFQIANATSKTFQLVQQAYQGMDFVELQRGDYIEGSFVVTNLGPYKNLLNGNMDSFWVEVRCQFEAVDQGGQIIFDYENVSGSSFNYSAPYAGRLTLSTFCSNGFLFQDAATPEIIFEYTVWEAVPTRIHVLSPINQKYHYSGISLNFTANKPLSRVGYSLDGKDAVTVDGNTTLTGLPNGSHKITIYANNTYGNMVHPETISFTVELDTQPPKVAVFPIENKTYDQDNLPLKFTVDESTSWMGYSLDGQANVTLFGNSTLTELSFGLHELTVYANDTFGNMGASETISFTIEEPFPTTLAIASVIAIAVVGVGLLFYFKKRKH